MKEKRQITHIRDKREAVIVSKRVREYHDEQLYVVE